MATARHNARRLRHALKARGRRDLARAVLPARYGDAAWALKDRPWDEADALVIYDTACELWEHDASPQERAEWARWVAVMSRTPVDRLHESPEVMAGIARWGVSS